MMSFAIRFPTRPDAIAARIFSPISRNQCNAMQMQTQSIKIATQRKRIVIRGLSKTSKKKKNRLPRTSRNSSPTAHNSTAHSRNSRKKRKETIMTTSKVQIFHSFQNGASRRSTRRQVLPALQKTRKIGSCPGADLTTVCKPPTRNKNDERSDCGSKNDDTHTILILKTRLSNSCEN